jgi:alkylhydroperoxidase family enzyme
VLKEKQKMTSVIDPREPPYSAGVADDLIGLMPPAMPPIALFRVLAHNPRVLSRFRAGRLLDAGTLPVRERELLILRVCRRCGCEYEWAIHAAVFGDAAGLTEADLLATTQPAAADPLSRRERLMLAAADELVADRTLTAVTAMTVKQVLSPAEIVELIAVVGRYIWVSMIANTAALPLETGMRTCSASMN